MEPIEYLRGLRRRWRVIVAAMAIGLAASWLVTGRDPSGPAEAGGYEASVVILDARSSQGAASGRTTNFSIETLAFLATTEDVAQRAVKVLDDDRTADELRAAVQASADEQTGIVTITATSDRPGDAETVASAFGDSFRDYLRDTRNHDIQVQLEPLRRQLHRLGGGSRGADAGVRASLQAQISQLTGEMASPIGLLILERTGAEEVNDAAISAPSSRLALLVIGLAVGLIGGIVLALVLEQFDRRIRSRQAAEQQVALQVLGEIPVIGRRNRWRVAVADRPMSLDADAFRLLAPAVVHMVHARSVPLDGNGHAATPPKVTIAITSAGEAEGKTLVAANLAAALGELGIKVIVLSCDLRRPAIHKYFDLPASPGVVDAVQDRDGQSGFDRACRSTAAANVSVITGGSPTGRPAALLAAKEMVHLIRMAQEAADVVLLDTPAYPLIGDATPLMLRANGVLLVMRAGKTTGAAAARVSEMVEFLGEPVLGLVFNASTELRSRHRNRKYRIERGPVSANEDRTSGLSADLTRSTR